MFRIDEDIIAWLIIPLNLLWFLIKLEIKSHVLKKRIEVCVVLLAITVDCLTIGCAYHLFWSLSCIVFYGYWLSQINWTQPKLAYEL